jgi:membrane protein YdbS with pleckstrin-like domain
MTAVAEPVRRAPVRDATTKVAKPLLLLALVVLAAGCDGDPSLMWHYWIAPVLMLSALFVVLVALPLGYYFKVWRLKHRGR